MVGFCTYKVWGFFEGISIFVGGEMCMNEGFHFISFSDTDILIVGPYELLIDGIYGI